jgi:hypothetical protein
MDQICLNIMALNVDSGHRPHAELHHSVIFFRLLASQNFQKQDDDGFVLLNDDDQLLLYMQCLYTVQ